jgi:hypothetical protein
MSSPTINKSSTAIIKEMNRLNKIQKEREQLPQKIIQTVDAYLDKLESYYQKGMKLVAKNPNASKVTFAEYINTYGFHQDADNSASLAMNLKSMKSIIKTARNHLENNPKTYLTIYQHAPWGYTCLDGQIDVLARITIDKGEAWDNKKPIESNIMNLIDDYIRPICDQIMIMFHNRRGDDITIDLLSDALEWYDKLTKDVVRKYILDLPAVKNDSHRKKAVIEVLDQMLSQEDILSITQEHAPEYVACADNVCDVATIIKQLNDKIKAKSSFKSKSRSKRTSSSSSYYQFSASD